MAPKIKPKSKNIIEKATVNPEPIVIRKSENQQTDKNMEEAKTPVYEDKKESKFKKRFMNRLPLNSMKIEDAGE